VADVVLHLAQSEEFVLATLGAPETGGRSTAFGEAGRAPDSGSAGIELRPGEGIDAAMERLVQAERAEPAVVLARWEAARLAALSALRAADPDVPVPWAATPLRPRTLATTRLAEHWAHGLDITGPLGLPYEDTARLWHIAWLGHRSLPYAYALAGEPAPEVYAELTAPAGDTWRFGPSDAPTRVEGPAGDFCRVGARRLEPGRSRLRVEGPAAGSVLSLLRNYAG
jgi:uncharacterized protein (TIGR03084 family)